MPFPYWDSDIWESPSRNVRCRVVVGGWTNPNHIIMTSADWLISCTITSEFCNGKLELGKAMSTECKLKFYNPFKVESPITGEKLTGDIEWERNEIGVITQLVDDNGEVITEEGTINSASYTLGEFYVTDVSSDDGWNTISITAYDYISKLDVKYEPAIEFPNTVGNIWEDLTRYLPPATFGSEIKICNKNGVDQRSIFYTDISSLGTAFNNLTHDYTEGTVREYVGWIAGLVGANAMCDEDGQIIFVQPSKCTHMNTSEVPYGIMRDVQYMGEASTDADSAFVLNSVTMANSTDSFTAGNGVGITITNHFATQESADYVLTLLDGYTYYPMKCKFRGSPRLRAGDGWFFEDKDYHVVHTLVMSCTYEMEGGFCSTVESYKTEEEVAIQTSPTEQAIQRVYNNLQAAIKEAAEVLKGAHGGIFRITDADNDGVNDGFIIADSESANAVTKCIVANYEGIGFSSDGGKTYQQAITHDGIVADAITTGQLDASRVRVNGNTLTDYVDIDSTGIKIGSSESSIVLKQTSDRLSFLSAGGEELAYFSPEAFSIEKLLRFRLGKAQIVVQPNGSLSLTKAVDS